MVKDLKKFEKIIGFKYPCLYLKVVELNLVNFEHWYLMDFDTLSQRREDLLKRYPNRNLVPFAIRGDNDDIACFEMGYGEKVFIVHDFSSEGFERRKEFDNFELWFMSAIKELVERDMELD
jgi:hypothetical protein